MKNNFTSLCVLGYKRPDKLRACLDSLKKTIDYPCEIILNIDGADLWEAEIFNDDYSKLIVSRGNNRGVGRSFQNCLGVAEGDYIFKLDTDLVFKEGWLSSSIKILEENPTVGAVGLFDYYTQDPNDERFKPENNIIEKKDGFDVVKDFVSCGYGFRAHSLDKWGREFDTIPDDGYHTNLGKRFGKLAMHHVVDNKSFGFDSVYVQVKPDGSATKTPTYDEPLLFHRKPHVL